MRSRVFLFLCLALPSGASAADAPAARNVPLRWVAIQAPPATTLQRIFSSYMPDDASFKKFKTVNEHITDPYGVLPRGVEVFVPDARRRPPRRPAEVPAGAEVHVVRKYETLSKIFLARGGTRDVWLRFIRLNPQFPAPALIFEGDEVLIPGWLVGRAPGAKTARLPALPAPKVERPAPEPAPVAAPADDLDALLGAEPPAARKLTWLDRLPFSDPRHDPLWSWHHLLSLLVMGAAFWVSRRRDRFKNAENIVLVLGLILSLRYLAWRGWATLNLSSTSAATFSVMLFAAELFALLSWVLFFLQVYKPRYRRHTPLWSLNPKDLPTVDVFVTIYNEPLDILRKTLVGAQNLDYPEGKLAIFVLDDGPREEIRDLAAEYGANYIARENHDHAKAGNVNHALLRTNGEFVMLLDTDHVPTRGAVKQMIGWFKDPKVSFVQCPHHFYNPDAYQRNLKLQRELAHEQDLFFQVIEPGRDGHNAAFFAGSSGMFRRAALDDIGGIQVESVIEDLHTSQRLHARGWSSVYVPYIVSGALSPESFPAYITQRSRWVRGGVQIFLKDNPFLTVGLSAMQRFQYFASILWFFHSPARLLFLVAPLFYLLLDRPPILANVWILSAFFFPHYVVQNLGFNLMSRGHRNPFWSDVYETVTAFALSWRALATLLRPDEMIFSVTKKGGSNKDAQGRDAKEERVEWAYMTPHLVLVALILLGGGVGIANLFTAGARWDATTISFVWAGYNILLLLAAMHVAREAPQVRREHRLHRAVAVRLDLPDETLYGMTTDLSLGGISLTLEGEHHLPANVGWALLGDYSEETAGAGDIVRCEFRDGKTHVGVKFAKPSRELEDAMTRQIFCAYGSWDELKRVSAGVADSVSLVARSAFNALKRASAQRPRRAWPRRQVNLPVLLENNGHSYQGSTVEVSATGCSVDTSYPIPPGETVILRMRPNRPDEIRVQRAEILRELPNPLRQVHRFAVRFLEPSHLNLRQLDERKTA